jgi:phosphoglycerate dehydrogenase-like enzyme
VIVLVSIHSPFVMWNIPAAHVEALCREFPGHTFRHAADDRTALGMIADAEVAFSAQIRPEHLAAAPRLRWIHSPAAGVGAMLFPAMIDSPIVLTNSRGLSADTIAEHVVAVTLALFRHLHVAVRAQVRRQWAQDIIGAPPANRMLSGASVLVVGLGAIGAAAAARMHALGARVSGVRRTMSSPAPPGVARVVPAGRMREVLPEADVVVIAAPQTRDTRGLVGAAELQAMRPDAILVNVSRGKLVDEEALVAALRAGTIGGAALDVFAHEPLSPESPLWDLPNVLITPHTSGFRPDHWDAATALFADNLRRFERGEPLRNIVDKHAGY